MSVPGLRLFHAALEGADGITRTLGELLGEDAFAVMAQIDALVTDDVLRYNAVGVIVGGAGAGVPMEQKDSALVARTMVRPFLGFVTGSDGIARRYELRGSRDVFDALRTLDKSVPDGAFRSGATLIRVTEVAQQFRTAGGTAR